MAGTQETIFIVKKAPVIRNTQGVITGTDDANEVDVKARYKRAKAREDVAKGNANPRRKFNYTYKRLKLS